MTPVWKQRDVYEYKWERQRYGHIYAESEQRRDVNQCNENSMRTSADDNVNGQRETREDGTQPNLKLGGTRVGYCCMSPGLS